MLSVSLPQMTLTDGEEICRRTSF